MKDDEVRTLYFDLLRAWNGRDAKAMAALCTPAATMIGFDGSEMVGSDAIEAALAPIFSDHPTASYVAIVREVTPLTDDVAVLRAEAGMIPPDEEDLDPSKNVVHTLVALRADDRWQVALYQNTPAAFDGRPEAVERLTDELRSAPRL
ncbi:MAG: hypothetical protein QOD98_493 [Nocardioidaceae bacterium]|jgi:uncharacterized protein (TIGR02246 family)|nr:hypothetical protein [Nocardioidaceae bacterium]